MREKWSLMAKGLNEARNVPPKVIFDFANFISPRNGDNLNRKRLKLAGVEWCDAIFSFNLSAFSSSSSLSRIITKIGLNKKGGSGGGDIDSCFDLFNK